MDTGKVAKGFKSARLRDYFRAAVRAGWTCRVTGSGHVQLRSPDGVSMVTMSLSAYDGAHGDGNIKSVLRRGGVDIR